MSFHPRPPRRRPGGVMRRDRKKRRRAFAWSLGDHAGRGRCWVEGGLFLLGRYEWPGISRHPCIVYHPPDIEPFFRCDFGDIQQETTFPH